MGTGNNTVLVIACCLLCAKARGKAGVLEGNEQRPEDIGGARRREGGGVFFALSCGWSLWLIRIMVALQIPLGNKVYWAQEEHQVLLLYGLSEPFIS